jgi:putative SOS response-associated peptidase YedK
MLPGSTGKRPMKRLYQPFPADAMEVRPVSLLVNSPRNDSPELIAPLS